MFESIDTSRRPKWKLRIIFAALGLALIAGVIWILRVTQMPLKSYSGPLPALSSEQSSLRDRLEVHVKHLSETLGERNLSRPASLQTAVQYLRGEFQQAGYLVTEQTYRVEGQSVSNLEVILTGTDNDSAAIIVGAHYDTAAGTPGADDNSTGVAAVLELARQFHGRKFRKTLRLVLFVNEEPPFFQTHSMGSLVYAQQLHRDHARVSAMIAVETIGFYSDAPGSQKYPAPFGLFYPKRGNFIAFVGNSQSRHLVRQAVRRFRELSSFPSEGIAAPPDLPGVGWSDHWSFWKQHDQAIMITDTAIFRYPYYHTPQDTPDRLDFARMSRVVEGIGRVVESLANQ